MPSSVGGMDAFDETYAGATPFSVCDFFFKTCFMGKKAWCVFEPPSRFLFAPPTRPFAILLMLVLVLLILCVSALYACIYVLS